MVGLHLYLWGPHLVSEVVQRFSAIENPGFEGARADQPVPQTERVQRLLACKPGRERKRSVKRPLYDGAGRAVNNEQWTTIMKEVLAVNIGCRNRELCPRAHADAVGNLT